MPRTAREKSHSGIYHIMLRGINKQNIFEEAEDYGKMLELIRLSKTQGGITLYGYCLMSNHIHLLLKEGKEPLETTMKRIGSKYAVWFNTKYQRVGHLFQDRFKSEVVEDPPYFLTVLRYIHFNPVKAGLVKTPGAYAYSSYGCYFGEGDSVNDGLIDTEKADILRICDESLERYFSRNLKTQKNHDDKIEYASGTDVISSAEKIMDQYDEAFRKLAE